MLIVRHMGAVVDTREQVRRRLRAARMLGDFNKPADLAEHPLCATNGITASLIIDTERKARDAKPMELQVIAEACGLPRQFFDAPFERMAEASETERLLRIEEEMTQTRERVEAFLTEVAASRVTQAVRDAAQATQQLADESQQEPGATAQTAGQPDRGD